jgi:hypothetical protein
MLHTGGQYKSRMLKMTTFYHCSFLLFVLCFIQVGSTRAGRLLMTTFFHCYFCYLLMPSNRWAIQESEGCKWRHHCSFFYLFDAFLQVGSTRAGRSNGSSWSNRKREATASLSGPSVILRFYIRQFSKSKLLPFVEFLEFVSVLWCFF